ncbi:MAG: hypothetical protein NT121_23425 [Chloroflexi bacterium]|nr:hypothetical protein [Chloroflexota bacterium]
MSPFLSLVALVAFVWQGLTFSAPNTWSFTGMVTETRQVVLYGRPATVARVQSADFSAWVIQRVETEGPEGAVVLGSAKVGERVQVSITGAHVFKERIDWSLCGQSAVCTQGAFYDDGPFSPDWNAPLSPGNEFIHSRHPNPSWEFALFWNTEILSDAPALEPEACLRPDGAHPIPGGATAAHAAAGLCHLVGPACGPGCLEPW